ncbi:MAG: hypothetical protein E7337_05815 [Clostridiales bacterium]|nr:hypothetical protein [Clostridiales bacterium]MBE5798408.1 hypothetical protein [Clostridiales bacterium]
MGNDILYPLRRLHGMIHEWWLYHKTRRNIKKQYIREIQEQFRKNPKSVILVFTPEHDNLGDHAIAFAETQMLEKAGIGYYEITGKRLENLEKYDLLGIMNGYPVLVQGGGYLGTLWYRSEKTLRGIIENNQGSVITLLPNTMYYEDSEWGRKEFQKSIDLYNQHDQLYIYAREKTSFNAMRNVYKNVKLIPDVVLSLNMCTDQVKRNGCLICLRNDCEKTRSEEEEACVIEQIKKLFSSNYRFTDMCVGHSIPVAQREKELEFKLDEFRHAELVITDRLHGMIFAAITGTPCIVINSKSPKVWGCYQWIKDLEYIRFADHVEDIQMIYHEVPQKAFVYDNSKLAHYYDELMKDLKNILEGKN